MELPLGPDPRTATIRRLQAMLVQRFGHIERAAAERASKEAAEAEAAFGLAEAPTTKPISVNAVLFTFPRASSSRRLRICLPSLGVAEAANGTATHGQGN